MAYNLKLLIGLYFLLSGNFLSCFAQDLIPNGDFEQGPAFTSPGWYYKIVPPSCNLQLSGGGPVSWSVLTLTPDRLIEGSIPCNWDNDSAAFGSAFVDFGPGESGQATLNSPLEQDSLYKLSCFLSLNTYRGLSNVPISLYFKFTGISDSIVTPLVSDTAWYRYETFFMASGTSSVIQVKATGNPSSIYSSINVDSLSLVKIHSTSTSIGKISELNNCFIYPNPANDIIYLKNSNEENVITVYDPLGNIVMRLNNVRQNSISIPPELSGIYYIEILSGERKFFQPLIIKH